MKHEWMVSLHGGHSGAYCDHAEDTLEAIVEAAIAAGFHTYGVSEHAPRVLPEHIFDEERAMGWDVARLDAMFTEYAAELARLAVKYAPRIAILKGFEIEVVPEDRYAALARDWRARHGFEYLVGSVHWVNGHIIDYTRERFEAAARACGGIEPLAIRYYGSLGAMARELRPEMIGHFDLIRRHAPGDAEVETPAIKRAAHAALEAVRDSGAILDVNTAGYRKGLGRPYPAPWIVREAHAMGIPFCFGDDSHRVSEVGAGIVEARQYLMAQGVRSIGVLRRGKAGLEREDVGLI